MAGFFIGMVILPLSLPSQEQAKKPGNLIGLLEFDNDPEIFFGHKVRVAFEKDDKGWKAFPHDIHTAQELAHSLSGFPAAVTWHICFDGKVIGSLSSHSPERINFYAQIGQHDIPENIILPVYGTPSLRFGGWTRGKVYRPLVLNTQPWAKDYDQWRPYSPPDTEVARVVKFLQKEWGEAEAKSGKEEIEQNQSYMSRARGIKLINLSMKKWQNAPEAGENDYWPYMAGVVCIVKKDKILYLDYGLDLIDAGDYDNDGKSELIFMVQKYNYDGYKLFFNDYQNFVEFGWHYH